MQFGHYNCTITKKSHLGDRKQVQPRECLNTGKSRGYQILYFISFLMPNLRTLHFKNCLWCRNWTSNRTKVMNFYKFLKEHNFLVDIRKTNKTFFEKVISYNWRLRQLSLNEFQWMTFFKTPWIICNFHPLGKVFLKKTIHIRTKNYVMKIYEKAKNMWLCCIYRNLITL